MSAEPRSYIVSMSVGAPFVEHEQYYQGHDDETVVGIGSTPRDALADALESIDPDLVIVCDLPTAPHGLSPNMLQAIAELWDATDFFAESTEARELDIDAHQRLVEARTAMHSAFASGHPLMSRADEDMVEDVLREDDRRPTWTLLHSSVTGCHPLTAENADRFDSEDTALRGLREYVARLQERGFLLNPEPSVDSMLASRYDVLEPEDCDMIPEEVGTVYLTDDSKECERENERRREGSELSVYVEVSLEILGPEDYSDEGIPDEDEIARLPMVRDRAERDWVASLPGGTDPAPCSGDVRRANIEHYARDLAKRIRGILCTCEDDPKGRAVALETVAGILGTGTQAYGVPDGAMYPEHTCLEVSNGETYRATLLLVNGERFELGSWGRWLEDAEQEYAEESGEQRCGHCGAWTEGVPTRLQAFCRPGYDLPDAPKALSVVVSSRSGGSTWGTVSGPADDVRSWLEDMEAPMATIPGTREDGSAEWRPRATIVLQALADGGESAGSAVPFGAGSRIVGTDEWESALEPAGRPILCGSCGNEVCS